MITQAIYELLNVSAITNLATGGVHPNVAPQGTAMPFVVWDETGTPENYKNASTISNYNVQIHIYCDKGKDGGGGFLQASGIYDAIMTEIDRYAGAIGGSNIDQIYLTNNRTEYDDVSEAATVIMDFNIRVRQ